MGGSVRDRVRDTCQLVGLVLVPVAAVAWVIGAIEIVGTGVLTVALVGIAATSAVSLVLSDQFTARIRDLCLGGGAGIMALWTAGGWGSMAAVGGLALFVAGFVVSAARGATADPDFQV